jgi:serine/threonine protein kinase
LVSDETKQQPGHQGVFANLIPRMEAVSDIAASSSGSPFVEAAGDLDILELTNDEIEDAIVFDLNDESEAEEPQPDSAFQAEEFFAPKETGQARLVKPSEIPPGHAELGGMDRPGGFAPVFDEDNAAGFVGRRIKGRFAATEYVGDNGSGHLFLGEDKLHDDRRVVIQIFHDDNDEIMRSILAEEIVSLSHFSHPNIARVIDSGEFVDHRRYVIAEHHDELSVADILSIHGRLPAERVAGIIKQVAYGLSDAHNEGLLHRDIEPGNIAIERSEGNSDRVVLVGMGLSKGDPDEYTAYYRAPEVLEGRIATVASDIYSLGVTAFEMLTGDLPFKADTTKDLINRQRNTRPQLPAEISSQVSPLAESVLIRAMSPNPASRFQMAREFGDALHHALVDCAPEVPKVRRDILAELDPQRPSDAEPPQATAAISEKKEIVLKPLAKSTTSTDDPAWVRRSPEPPSEGSHIAKLVAAIGIPLLLILLGVGWYFLVKTPVDPSLNSIPVDPGTGEFDARVPNTNSDIEVPPLPRSIPQPPNTSFYQNTKQNLKGDLLLNFVGFTVYYPKDWKVNGPQVRENVNSRGKFLDISRENADGMLKEQMLISYYPSRGTYKDDADKFPQLVKEANETLKKLLPGYEPISEGETRVNGEWKAYELKFRAGGRSSSGDNMMVWGRRIFIPAARPGVRAGFEITLLATSFSDEVKSVDDVGTKGELAKILYTFEPSQNF